MCLSVYQPQNILPLHSADQLHAAVVDDTVHRMFRRLRRRMSRVDRRQVVHRVARLARDLAADFEKTRQLQLVAGQRRECLKNHQTLTSVHRKPAVLRIRITQVSPVQHCVSLRLLGEQQGTAGQLVGI